VTQRVLLLLGMVAWLVAGVFQVVHETETRHVACADHGETVELGAEGAADPVDTVRAQDLGAEHHHGCVLDGLTSPLEIAPATLLAERVALDRDEPAELTSSRHGLASLATAPKRGPPARI